MIGLQAFQCANCKKVQKKLRSGWTASAIRLVFLFGLLVGGVYFWRNGIALPDFRGKDGGNSSRSEAEALARMRTSAGGQLSNFEQMMTKKPKGTLDNATIMQLWKANVGTNIILQMVRTSNADYDLSAGAIIQLRQAQVDQSIILAMIDSSYSAR